jgi:hypothetical protein
VLGRAYQLDLDLASGVESVAGEASRLSTALRPALTGMLAAVDALDQRMTERESILRAIK